jgi:hypothetical protein
VFSLDIQKDTVTCRKRPPVCPYDRKVFTSRAIQIVSIKFQQIAQRDDGGERQAIFVMSTTYRLRQHRSYSHVICNRYQTCSQAWRMQKFF